MLPFLLVANKVALLIGNKDYHFQQLGRLFHPINDACDLTGRLVNMGFKVSCWTALNSFVHKLLKFLLGS